MTRGKGEGSPRKRKDGRWEFAITVGKTETGNPKRVSFYGKTRAEVTDKAAKSLADLRAGTFTANDPTTVAQLLERWLKLNTEGKRLKATTAHSYAWIVEKYIAANLGDRRVQKLTPYDVETFQAKLARNGLSPRTIRYARALLSSALKRAVRWGLVQRNVVDGTDAPRLDKPKRTVWTPAQLRAFLDAARTERLYTLFHLAVVTGLRRGELLGLRWQDLKLEIAHHTQGAVGVEGDRVSGEQTGWQAAGILLPARIGFGSNDPSEIIVWSAITGFLNNNDLIIDTSISGLPSGTPYVIEELRGTLRIENTVNFLGAKIVQQTPKTDESERFLDLDPLTVGLLFERQAAYDLERRAMGEDWQAHDLVFGSSRGTPMFESTLRRIKARLCKAAGVPQLTVHGFRYTYTSLAALRRLDIKVVSERLGHATTRMTTEVYQQTYREGHRAAALSADELIGKSPAVKLRSIRKKSEKRLEPQKQNLRDERRFFWWS